MKTKITLIAFFIALAGIFNISVAEVGSTSICYWKDNKKAALTISIDDNCWGDVPFVTSVVNPRGIKVTWNLITARVEVNPDFFGTWENWRTIPAMGMGHELGSHTVNHPGRPTDTPTREEIRLELRDSKLAIEENVPDNGKCLSIAYSSSWNDETIRCIASEYYITGRGVTGGINTGNPPLDTTSLQGIFWTTVGIPWSPQMSPGQENAEDVDRAISNGGWYIWTMHQINDSPGNVPTAFFTAFCDYAYSKRDVLWFGTHRDVAQYIYERKTSVVTLVSASSSRIDLNLTHDLSVDVCDFDYPLTLKTEVDESWNAVTVTQDGSSSVLSTVKEAGKTWLYYDAIPNKGVISLSAVQTGIENISTNVTNKELLYVYNQGTSMTINYKVPVSGFVKLDVYDISGRLVETIVSENKSVGDYLAKWDTSCFGEGGVYFVHMYILPKKSTNAQIFETKKILITK